MKKIFVLTITLSAIALAVSFTVLTTFSAEHKMLMKNVEALGFIFNDCPVCGYPDSGAPCEVCGFSGWCVSGSGSGNRWLTKCEGGCKKSYIDKTELDDFCYKY